MVTQKLRAMCDLETSLKKPVMQAVGPSASYKVTEVCKMASSWYYSMGCHCKQIGMGMPRSWRRAAAQLFGTKTASHTTGERG